MDSIDAIKTHFYRIYQQMNDSEKAKIMRSLIPLLEVKFKNKESENRKAAKNETPLTTS